MIEAYLLFHAFKPRTAAGSGASDSREGIADSRSSGSGTVATVGFPNIGLQGFARAQISF